MTTHGNIRDTELFLSQLWPWDIFDGCFGGTAIRVTDIDGMVERNGHVLFIETKKLTQVNQPLPKGQSKAYDVLAQQPNMNVIVLWGNPGQPEYYQVWGKHLSPQPTSLADIQQRMKRWFEYANSHPVQKSESAADRQSPRINTQRRKEFRVKMAKLMNRWTNEDVA